MSQGERKVQSAFTILSLATSAHPHIGNWPLDSYLALWQTAHVNAREESPLSTPTHSTSTFMRDFDFIVSVGHVFLPENGHKQSLLEMH